MTDIQDIIIFITGSDMSNAFDTTCRDQIIKIAEEVLMEDERQTLTTLLAKTIPEEKIEEIQITPLGFKLRSK